jgi:putative tryptophan/tyrosine transport system substrate-binding protein
MVLEMHAVQAADSTLGIDQVTTVEIRRTEDITSRMEALEGKADAIYVAGDALISTNRDRVNSLALGARLPTMHIFGEIVSAGGLISYAPNYLHLFERAADYVDKVLRGARPSEMPVEQPTPVRAGDQSQNSKGARSHGAAVAARSRRRGD